MTPKSPCVVAAVVDQAEGMKEKTGAMLMAVWRINAASVNWKTVGMDPLTSGRSRRIERAHRSICLGHPLSKMGVLGVL
jgi:hypothetical protein